jgi:hypothetical protein
MQGLNARNVVVRESDLTRRIGNDAEVGVAEFVDTDLGETAHAHVLLKTPETSEARAKTLLDLTEDAFVRLLGGGDDVDVSLKILTHQNEGDASVKLSDAALDRATRSLGIVGLPVVDMENFVFHRLATEYHTALLRFNDTDIVIDPALRVQFQSGRSLRAERRRRHY